MKRFYLAILLSVGAIQASADDAALIKQAENSLIQAFGPNLVVEEATKIADGQLLEVRLNDNSIVHMTPDAKFLIYRDELYSLSATGAKNVTKARSNPRRAKQMAAVSDDKTVVFPARGKQKALVNVFTDIDCGYCQKLHKEVDELNRLGITVRYLAYPRAGIKNPQTGQLTASYKKLNYVWCQKDSQSAMTTMKSTQRQLNTLSYRNQGGSSSELDAVRSKMTKMISGSKECGSPVAEHYQLGQSLGVRGTPAIVSQNGELFPGYVPAGELAKRLGL